MEIEENKPDLEGYYDHMSEHSRDETLRKLYSVLAAQTNLNNHYNERLQELERIVLHGVRIEYEDEDEIEYEDGIIPGQRMENPRWEYATFFFDKDVFENEDKVLEDLNGYGKEGWELVSISDALANYPTAVMKRRL